MKNAELIKILSQFDDDYEIRIWDPWNLLDSPAKPTLEDDKDTKETYIELTAISNVILRSCPFHIEEGYQMDCGMCLALNGFAPMEKTKGLI